MEKNIVVISFSPEMIDNVLHSIYWYEKEMLTTANTEMSKSIGLSMMHLPSY